MSAFEGQIALVTGANRGLGLESVRQLSALGFTVLLAGRSRQRALEAAQTIGSPRARSVTLDVTSDADVATCGELIRREHGARLDNPEIHMSLASVACKVP